MWGQERDTRAKVPTTRSGRTGGAYCPGKGNDRQGEHRSCGKARSGHRGDPGTSRRGACCAEDQRAKGAALASLFRLPDSAADDAASWQQFATAAIVELLILCSFIAFELLSPARVVVQVLPPVAHPRALKLVSPPDPAQAVLKFLSERVPRAKGSEANWSDITGALPVWWARQGLAGDPPSDAQLESILRRVSDQCDMPMRKRGGRAYFVGRKLA